MRRRLSEALRDHPLLAASLGACLGLGVFAAFHFLPPEWSTLRRSAAGIVGGTGVWFLMVAPRLVG